MTEESSHSWRSLLARDWLLVIAGAALIVSSVATRRIPSVSASELQVVFVLFVLLVTVKGLEHGGLFSRLAWHMDTGKAAPLKLVATTFILSMLITNDVALIVVVPLTLALNVEKKDTLVILEALAANAGSALTPIGNPQNLYIYWYYSIQPTLFIKTIAPLSMVFFVILAVAAAAIKSNNGTPSVKAPPVQKPLSYGFAVLLSITVLMVLHVLPLYAGLAVMAAALLLKPSCLRIDYGLLAAFLCFFGTTQSLGTLLTPTAMGSDRVFWLSTLSSQIISNVPAALLFAKFTHHWQALLWGVNAGGFGSLVGSLANLIAYRLYITAIPTAGRGWFAVRMTVIGYGAFLVSIGLYALTSRE